jgi:hypothetical protein
METQQNKLINSVLKELMIKKALVEGFDQERAELLDSEIYQLKQLLNEKTNKERSASFGHSTNIIRQA